MFAKRDVFALLLSCFAVYYSTLSEGVVSFHPAFVVARDVGPGETAWDAPGFLSGRFDGRSDVDDPTDARNKNKRDDHPPPPKFFDLNGDGVREMLVATGGSGSGDEPQLRMVEMSREDIGGNKGRDRQRRRANANSYSRATEDVLAGERGVRGGAQSFFGSVDAFERARVLARASLAQPPPRGEGGDSDTDEEREETDEHERERSGRSFGSRAPIALGVGAVRPASFGNASSSVASKRNSRRSIPSNSRKGSRKGVVVVVTEGWHVVCFDHNLRVMWERALGGDFPRHAKPREAAVLVTAAAVFEGDRGTVIVGGRVDSGVIDEESDVFGSFDPLNAELERERAVRTRAGGDASRSAASEATASSNAKSLRRHFNYYAFETGTGEIRWTHESDDFHRDVRGLADALVPQHDHKLDAAAREANEGRHFGEAACREFRESVVRFATPHRWTGREDTSLVLARFQHHKEASSWKARKAPVEGGSPFFRDDGDFEAELDEDAFPNVFVAHQEEGIEVVHLFGGRTVCKMLLTPLDAHADVNGDGVLEHVSARGGGGAGAGGGLDAAGEMFLDEQKGGQKTKHHDRNCWARVSAGTPPRGVVFEGSICRGSMGVTRHKRRDGGGADDANAGGFISGNTVEVASPVALRRPQDSSRRAERAFSGKRNARRSETLRDGSAGDRSRRDKETKRQKERRFSPPNAVFDLVFLNSRGEMTSYTHEGVRRWQQRTDSGWARGSGETPSFFSFPLRRRVGSRDSETEVALAVGATRATFVTPSGYVLATLKLPARPIAPVLIEDVNGDGLNDVVLRTERGVFAWTQKSRVGAKPFSVLAGALCLLVGGVFLAQVAHAHSSGMKRLVRSTDMDDFEGRKER